MVEAAEQGLQTRCNRILILLPVAAILTWAVRKAPLQAIRSRTRGVVE